MKIDLSGMAQPAAIKYGQQIANSGGVEILERSENEVVASVSSGQKRKVTLKVGKNGLVWKCTCTTRTKNVCRHAVAVAFAVTKTH